MSEVVDIKEVSFAYGGALAVDKCSFTIESGQVTGLIGPNGAGKSTLIEILAGRLRPRSGTIIFDGMTSPVTAPRSVPVSASCARSRTPGFSSACR